MFLKYFTSPIVEVVIARCSPTLQTHYSNIDNSGDNEFDRPSKRKHTFSSVIIPEGTIAGVKFQVYREPLESVSTEMKNHICNNMREGIENRLILHDVTPETFARFLSWLYTRHSLFVDEDDRSTTINQELRINFRMFAFAEKFNITDLTHEVARKVQTILWNSKFPMHEPDGDATKECCEIINELLDSVPSGTVEAYYDITKSAPGLALLLNSVAEYCTDYAGKFLKTSFFKALFG